MYRRAGFAGESVEALERVLGQVVLVYGNIQLALYFRT